jgi:hypothetical protein
MKILPTVIAAVALVGSVAGQACQASIDKGSYGSAASAAADASAAMDAAIAAADAAMDAPVSNVDPAFRLQFSDSANATAEVDAALAAARNSGRHVLVIYGGNWCHDSNALLDILATPRTHAMVEARYEVVLVDVGHFDRNLDVARCFGLDGIAGTPTVLILDGNGTPTNLADAPTWRNAASRKAAAIHRALERAVPPVGA